VKRPRKPKLVDNWKHILRNAWSVRLMVIAAVLSGLEVALPFLPDYVFIPHGIFAAFSGVLTAAAFAARLLAQRSMEDASDN